MESGAKVVRNLPSLLVEVAHRYGRDFTLEELIVDAWLTFPEKFGLSGFAQYPDSNRVIAALSGKRSPVATGHFERVSPKLYRVIDTDGDGSDDEPEEYRPPMHYHPPDREAAASVFDVSVEPMDSEIRLWREGKRGQAERAYQQRLMRQQKNLSLVDIRRRLKEVAAR